MNRKALFAVGLVILVVSVTLVAARPSTSVAQGLCEYPPYLCPVHACLKKDEIRIVNGPTDCKESEEYLTLSRGETPIAMMELIGAMYEEFQATSANVEALETQVEDLEARVAELEGLLQHFSRVDNDITITGANLHVVNGGGTTADVNGLGNIIIGYNELRSDGDNVRTGSHTLVVGSENNYGWYGGIVVGFHNSVERRFAAVTGGRDNTASGEYSSVSGGIQNMASGLAASVSGGTGNTASNNGASVSGGGDGTASGNNASVSGGSSNIASGERASVSGGAANTALLDYTSVSGGSFNTASARWSSVGGGTGLDADEIHEFLPWPD